jgi:hypothetical protein
MLATTLLVGMNGPQPLPNSALVKVSGCLQSDAKLTAASGLTRIRRADDASSEELALASASEAGSAEYLLRNADAALAGNKVLIKGVFAAAGTINVLALASTGQNCN